MADISKIKVSSTTYNIKDSTARTSLESIGTASNFMTKERIWGTQQSLTSGTYYFNQTINVTKSNYTPVCLTGFGVANGDNGSGYSQFQVYKAYLSSTTAAAIYVRHFLSNTALSVKPYVDVLYRRN